jgi:hypothetical protein
MLTFELVGRTSTLLGKAGVQRPTERYPTPMLRFWKAISTPIPLEPVEE